MGGGHRAADLARDAEEVTSVPGAQHLRLAGFYESIASVLPQRLQQSVAQRCNGVVGDHDRLGDEAREEVEHSGCLDIFSRAHDLGRVEGEATREDRESPEQAPFRLR